MKKVIVIGIFEKFDESKHKDEEFYFHDDIGRVWELIDRMFLLDPNSTSLYKILIDSRFVCLYTDEQENNLEEFKITDLNFIYNPDDIDLKNPNFKLYKIKSITEREERNARFINRFKRKYENKPNFLERIFGFDDKV